MLNAMTLFQLFIFMVRQGSLLWFKEEDMFEKILFCVCPEASTLKLYRASFIGVLVLLSIISLLFFLLEILFYVTFLASISSGLGREITNKLV